MALAFGASTNAIADTVPLVDANQTGTINIHKFQQPTTMGKTPADGTQQDTTGLTPISGVEFTVQQVPGVDLTTNAGWVTAAGMTVADAQTAITDATPPVPTPVVNTTISTGDASFTGLPLGLYLVTETSVPSGVTPGDPFLVTLPMTDPTDHSQWMYSINVYPKNAVTSATKTVTDADAVKLGDPVTFTITSDVPEVGAGDTIDGYKVVDVLDSKLTYTGASVALKNGAKVAEGTDYTVAFDSSTNTVTVTFTPAGLQVLTDNDVANQVITVIKTAVNTVGEISNQAVVYPNKPSFDVQPPDPNNPDEPPAPDAPIVTPPGVTTKWGNIDISKVDSVTGATISGVTFELFLSQADATAQTNPVSIDGTTDWTTDSTGAVTIPGLRYSGWANGAAVSDGQAGYQEYWLVETKAASGYALLATPVQVDVNAVDTVVTIKNVPVTGNIALPLTGGTAAASTWLLYGAGVLVLAGVIVVVVRMRRRTVDSDI